MKRPKSPPICPICEEEVPPGSWACPECGADHNSGWREDADSTDSLGSADELFDYDKFVREEFGPVQPVAVNRVWWVTALVLIVALAALYLLGAF